MLKVSPAQLVISSSITDYKVTIDANGSSFSAELVMLSMKDNKLTTKKCEFSNSLFTSKKDVISINSNELQKSILTCNIPESAPALRIFPTSRDPLDNKLMIKEEIILPIIISNEADLLNLPRTQEILGVLQSTLVLNDYSCSPVIIYSQQTINCSGTITNATDAYISMTVTSTSQIEFPQQLTNSRNILLQQMLLFPKQTISFSETIAAESIEPGIHKQTISAAFKTPTSNNPYFSTKTIQFLYIPWQLIIIGSVLLLVFFAILLQKFYIRFFINRNANQKIHNINKPSKA